MTLALGFKARDGIVLCSDSQITKDGGLKYDAQKIFTLVDDRWAIALAYAGSPDLMKHLLEEMNLAIETDEDDSLPQIIAHNCLQKTMEELHKNHRAVPFEVLCAISTDIYGQAFYRAKRNLVVSANDEFMGVGDSSVIRYLVETLRYPTFTPRQCLIFGSYVVAQAKKYVQGCGGPLQAVLLEKGRAHVDIQPTDDESELRDVGKSLRDFFFVFTNDSASEAQKIEAMEAFVSAAKEIGK